MPGIGLTHAWHWPDPCRGDIFHHLGADPPSHLMTAPRACHCTPCFGEPFTLGLEWSPMLIPTYHPPFLPHVTPRTQHGMAWHASHAAGGRSTSAGGPGCHFHLTLLNPLASRFRAPSTHLPTGHGIAPVPLGGIPAAQHADMMGRASDACPWETLQQRGLEADMVVDIDGVTWPLHRHVLLPHCPLIHSLLPAATAAASASACEGEQGVMPLALATGLPIVALTGFPGGPRSFSIIARWCYGSRPNLSPSQAAAVLFAARFLGMEDRGSEALIPVAVRAVKGGLAEGWQACFDILERCYHDRVLDALVVEFSLNRHFVDSAASAILKLESKLVGDGRWGNDDWATVNRLLEGMSKLPPDISRRVVQQLWDLRHSHWATVCPAPCCEAGEEHAGIKAMATVGSFLLGITLLSKMEWRRQHDDEEEKTRKKGGQGSAGSSSSPSHAGNSPWAQAPSSSVRSRAQPPYDNILWMLRVLKLFISPPFDRPILLVLSNNTPLLETHHLHFLDLSSCLALLTLVSAAPRQDSHLVATADLLDVYLATQGTKRNPPLSPEDFRALVTRLPPEARPTHDGLFEAVCAFAEADPRPATWNLLALVDCGRLTPRCLRLAASAAASMEFGQSAVAGFWLFLVSLLRALMYEG
ncbi:unnamed protein product [Closterium sp. NIES-65]|nr:unnamed protein product [Closterium sp. NIES-65]